MNTYFPILEINLFGIHLTDVDGWTATNDGWNCLHIAALFGHLSFCKILKDKHNFDVHMADKDGSTAVHHSARHGSYDLWTYFADMGVDIELKLIMDGTVFILWHCVGI